MTDGLDLSRRKLLGSAATLGLAGAIGGSGTMAFFSDEENYANNQLVAGELDLKVAASQHYVDWRPDTAGGPEAPQETDDASMPEDDGDVDLTLDTGAVTDQNASPIELAIGDPAGLANGSLVNDINGGVPLEPRDSLCDVDAGGDDDAAGPIIDLDDVKPGDFGFVRFEFASCTNPAFVELFGELQSASENGTTEPEAADADEGDGVELLDEVQLALLGDDVANLLGSSVEIGSGDGFAGTSPVTLGTLERADGRIVELLEGDIAAEEGGGTGARDCFSGETNHRYTLVWWLPVDHANEIQTDTARFSLGIGAEQCRHNNGTVSVNLSTGTADWRVRPPDGDGFVSAAQVTAVPNAWDTADCAEWIDTPGGDGTNGLESDPPGVYRYEVDFTVPTDGCTLEIDTFGADNPVAFYVDDTGDSIGGSSETRSFDDLAANGSISEPVSPGDHTLIALVTNEQNSGSNPTGLFACAELECSGGV